MIDIHPPRKSDHTWTDFFIHIATICVGLLIAIALEQSVEHIHHRHQAAELRDSLHAESEQVLSDADRCIAAEDYRAKWLIARIDQVKQTVWQHQALARSASFNALHCSSPDIPIWRTAKESGLAFYLTKGEVTGYSEIEFVVSLQSERLTLMGAAYRDMDQFLATFPSLPDGGQDLSVASPEDLRRYLTLLTAQLETTLRALTSLHQVRGAVRSVAGGETRLNAIYQAERAEMAADPLLNLKPHF
jgi:hypothetical protein